MGCDIHGVIEVLGEDAKWHAYSQPVIHRCYDLFYLLAGVRNSSIKGIKPISEPRGLPNDISYVTELLVDNYRLDGHSHSWINLKEMNDVLAFCKKKLDLNDYDVFDYFMGNLYSECEEEDKLAIVSGGKVRAIRYVFWFDN